jgi:tetratricopeptide (TPR) repeat protein
MDTDEHEQYVESQLCIEEGDYDAAYELLADLLQIARRKKVDFEKEHGKMSVAMPEGEIKEAARAVCFELATASHELAKLHDIEGDYLAAIEQFDLAIAYFNWSGHFGVAKSREAQVDAQDACIRHQVICGRENLLKAHQTKTRKLKTRRDNDHAS